jgi:hypothetical protein
MIAGHETYEHVLAALAALEAEYPRNERHAASIAEQKKLFQAEAEDVERLEREHEARLAAAKKGASRI